MADPLLKVSGLHKRFQAPRVRRAGAEIRAVDGVDMDLARGEVLGLVGESGCGKSTVAWCVAGLHEPTEGTILFDGRPLGAKVDRNLRRRVQMVFQDPNSSLNPRMTVGQTLREILRVHGVRSRHEVNARTAELLELVGMGRSSDDAYPRQLSGGQRQRVSIARALAPEPELLLADEPVSSLDVSVQATILNLLRKLQRQLGLTMLFIAHDLSVVRHISDRVSVMYLGRVVETAPTAELFSNPRHPYTQGLLRAIPRLTGGPLGSDAAIRGELPSPIDIPPGCRFHPRCPIAQPVCSISDPRLIGDSENSLHVAACHFAWTDQSKMGSRLESSAGASG